MQSGDGKRTLDAPGTTLIFIHSPFCGTCHLARKMLTTLEVVFNREVFKELNASLYPELMKKYKIESVPCLVVTKQGQIKQKIYAFHSVSHMYEQVVKYVEY
ncbi:thioredoxin family protein [Halobacillus karajensis]|nr:thioredoxin family protein [Halobacillus karajensis]